MIERHEENRELRDYLEGIIALLDANPGLRPCVMARNGAFDGLSYLHPSGWEADLLIPYIAQVRCGADATVWLDAPDEKANGWTQENYETAEPETVILLPIT